MGWALVCAEGLYVLVQYSLTTKMAVAICISRNALSCRVFVLCVCVTSFVEASSKKMSGMLGCNLIGDVNLLLLLLLW